MIGTLALYNKSKLLLRNTLITDPQQIPNGLVCTNSMSGGIGRFRFEGGTAIQGSRQGQSTTVQRSQLNQNGPYVCYDGGREQPFHIYFSNGEYILRTIGIYMAQGGMCVYFSYIWYLLIMMYYTILSTEAHSINEQKSD